MDVDGVTTPPPRGSRIASKTGSLSKGRRIAFAAIAAGIPIAAFAIVFMAPSGGPDAADPGDSAAQDDPDGDAMPGMPDIDDTLPAEDFDGDGVPDVEAPDPGNLTDGDLEGALP